MFLKLDLFLICVFLFNISKVRCDCDDFITCVGSWIGDLLVNDSKEVAARAVEVPDVLSDVGDILTNISHLIEEKFDNITKETSLMKNIENKTVIHVQTFKVENKSNETFQTNKIELPSIIKNNSSESSISNVLLQRKENQTKNINELKNDGLKLTTEISVTVTEPANSPAGDIVNFNKITLYNLLNGIGSKYYNDSLKRTLGEGKINNKASTHQKSSTRHVEATTEVTVKLNITHKSPVNQTNFETLNSLNNENQNSSRIFINIPQTVASNYKITFESPINVTYFEINTKEDTEMTTYSTDINQIDANLIKDLNKNIINQNTEENEIILTDDELNYNIEEDNITDYLAIDYIELYKDTTNEDVAYTLPTYTFKPIEAVETSNKMDEANGIESIFPWIATLFIKNNENNQFEYICDGAVVSDVIILTAARCVTKSNVTENVSDILVILGKRSLQATGANEKVVRVKSVKLHENFTAADGKVANDLAVVILEEPIVFNDDIKPVPIKYDDFEPIQSATTGWHVTGPLTPIYFGEESSKTCKKETDAIYTFCATFGDDITTCPSYGGLFVSRRTETDWGLQGITSGNPTNKGVCFNKNVTFTNLSYYYHWIMENVDANKVN